MAAGLGDCGKSIFTQARHPTPHADTPPQKPYRPLAGLATFLVDCRCDDDEPELQTHFHFLESRKTKAGEEDTRCRGGSRQGAVRLLRGSVCRAEERQVPTVTRDCDIQKTVLK